MIKQRTAGGRTHKGVGAGRWCDTAHFPTRVEWRGRSSNPADIGDFDNVNSEHVSDGAKNFIENHEPDVHQFIPFEMLKANKPFQHRYWWVIGNRLDTVDRARTTCVLFRERVWRPVSDLVRRGYLDEIPPGIDPNTKPSFAFNPGRIGTASVWWDKFIDGGAPLVSPQLAEALRSSGLTGHWLTDAGEISPE